jgi:hypothetical protein
MKEKNDFADALPYSKGKVHATTLQDIAQRDVWIAEINSELATRNC